MHSTSIPAAVTASISSSGVVVLSPLHIVWLCMSTRTNPSATGWARCGCRAIAAGVALGTGRTYRRSCLPGTAVRPRSGPAHRHVADHQAHACGTHRQPVDVSTDLDDIEQHPLQRRRDRELADRLADLAVRDQQAR